MNKSRRFLSLLLALVICIGMLPASALAEHDYEALHLDEDCCGEVFEELFEEELLFGEEFPEDGDFPEVEIEEETEAEEPLEEIPEDDELFVSEIPESFLASPSGTVYLAFSSDVHNKSGNQSANRLSDWLNGVSAQIGTNFADMGFCGDMGDAQTGESSFWSLAQTAIDVVRNSSKVNGKGFFVPGNHEWSPGNFGRTSSSTKNYYTPADGAPVETDNYVLYSFGATNNSQTFEGTYITALETYLKTAPANIPIFILSHFPLHDTNSRRMTDEEKVIKVLNDYGDSHELIFLWGHNHTDAGGAEKHYDTIYHNTFEGTAIKFTYAAAGCMCDTEYGGGAHNVNGKGLVVKIVNGKVDWNGSRYYGIQNGSSTTHTHAWSSWTSISDTQHQRSCSNSGCTESPQKAAHNYVNGVCAECGHSHESHSWGGWTKSSSAQHQRSCSICGLTQTENHKWGGWTSVSDLQHRRTCSACGATETENHIFVNGTCTVCGKAEPVHRHNWSSWTSISDTQHQRSCSNSGCTQSPERAGHNYVNGVCTECGHSHEVHIWGNWTATDTQHSRTCISCGATESENHDLVNGVCTVCGYRKTEEPDKPLDDFVSRLYEICLGRTPSEDEVKYYRWGLTDNGMTGTQAAYKFIFGDEFLVKCYCDRHYTEALYNAFMGRNPSEGETDNWVWRLQQGDTREDVFNKFATSSEFQAICRAAGINPGTAVSYSGSGTRPGGRCTVAGCISSSGSEEFTKRLYNVCLDRDPSSSEVDAWVYYLIHGDHTGTSASKSFLFSDEFKGKQYDDGAFVEHLYSAMMGRTPAADENDYWVWRLTSTDSNRETREQVFSEFAGSDEFAVICANYGIVLN